MFSFFRKKNTAKNAAQKKIENYAKRPETVIFHAFTTAQFLNVRTMPEPEAKIIGKLAKNTAVSIFKIVDNDWYMIKYNNADAYIASKFVKNIKGRVNTKLLNVRNQPTLNSEIIGKLILNDSVEVILKLPDWYKIKYKTYDAYVSAKFITLDNASKEEVANNSEVYLLKNNSELLHIKPEASEKIKIPATPTESKIVAQTYNNYGNLLEVLSKEINISLATAVAVLAVESAGKGFSENGNVTVRFENHLFYRFWGQNNKSVFDKHFTFDSEKNWEGHKFRKDENQQWQTFHGNQNSEWEVLQFARTLNNEAALKSASYGAPQILGTNFKKIGYKNTEDMLFYFNRDIKFQIFAFFDFLNPTMIKHLQNKEFQEFASYYNGKGQEIRYGEFIKKHYQAFKQLKA